MAALRKTFAQCVTPGINSIRILAGFFEFVTKFKHLRVDSDARERDRKVGTHGEFNFALLVVRESRCGVGGPDGCSVDLNLRPLLRDLAALVATSLVDGRSIRTASVKSGATPTIATKPGRVLGVFGQVELGSGRGL